MPLSITNAGISMKKSALSIFVVCLSLHLATHGLLAQTPAQSVSKALLGRSAGGSTSTRPDQLGREHSFGNRSRIPAGRAGRKLQGRRRLSADERRAAPCRKVLTWPRS